ncbi:DNA adenine methylase [Blautia sp. MCC283]|uniref:DNA adenine methylase n=1 Tax=Blautia sp. MCC283 TaxID=2592640 RepID=UPI001C0221DA|nr:DNA adenine methylase [Blautia sp. MCC283]MBT9840063.1 DNA adenine methylase [Blautia sp. MCC283]
MSNTNSCRAVLRYPGSKWRIAFQLCEYIPKHPSYLEPYFGSGAVFFTKQPSAIETINDLDLDVVNLFSCLRDNPDKLASMIYATPYARYIYDRQFNEQPDLDPYEKALGFLIKCWMGHGYRTNGYKVGWKNDVQGRERAYSLLNWQILPDWVLLAADRLKQAQIECMPAIDLIRRFDYENVFMYVDPPYVLSTRAGKQYKHEMADKDHMELLDVLLDSKAKIMLSGYAHPLYDEKLKEWKRIELKNQSTSGKVTTEIIWMNYRIGSYVQQTLF